MRGWRLDIERMVERRGDGREDGMGVAAGTGPGAVKWVYARVREE